MIDDRVAFVGGVDLTSEAGDRYDASHHPARAAVGWHDVAARIEGPAVADVAEHFNMRWHEVTGEQLPAPAVAAGAGEVELQIIRTIPEKIYKATPKGDFSILESYVKAFRGAQTVHLPRKPVPLVAGDLRRSSPRRSRTRRPTTSGSSCCCP